MDIPCIHSYFAVKDEEIKTYAPEDIYAKDATFTVSMEDKYYKRRQMEADG
jgi:hypothetical protein